MNLPHTNASLSPPRNFPLASKNYGWKNYTTSLSVRCKIDADPRQTDIRISLAAIPTDGLISRIIKNYREFVPCTCQTYCPNKIDLNDIRMCGKK